MKLFMDALEREVDELHRRGVRIRFIGDRSRFEAPIRERMAQAEAQTAGNGRLSLNIAASYGGRQDIAMAARSLAEDVAAGRLRPEDIDEAAVGARSPSRLPPPDLFIAPAATTDQQLPAVAAGVHRSGSPHAVARPRLPPSRRGCDFAGRERRLA